MENVLIKYLSNRYENTKSITQQAGPVITISREYGCPAKSIAAKLSTKLTDIIQKKGSKESWKWISKEILVKAAKQLKTDPEQIKYVFNYERKSMIEEILHAQMNNHYINEAKIKHAIGKVIRTIGMEGNIIIVGRGGVSLTKDIPNSFHIHLEAPLDWKSVIISERKEMAILEAKEYVIKTDEKRKQFRDFYQGKNTDYTRFDVTFNCMTLSENEIVNMIIPYLMQRNFV